MLFAPFIAGFFIACGLILFSISPGAAIAAFWLSSPFMGGAIGDRRDALGCGVWLGFLFGPVGVFCSLFLDGRQPCTVCAELIRVQAKLCPHCHSRLFWGVPYDPEDDEDSGVTDEVVAVVEPPPPPAGKATFRRSPPAPPLR